MTATTSEDMSAERAFLNTVEGEISFFRSIMRARPVGVHRYFHILTIRNAILRDTGRNLHVETIWEKLKECYDLDALDAIDLEADGYLHKSNSSPISIRSPSPSENLNAHPFFREEFSLPYEEFEPIIAQRRLRETASLPSSPAASPAPVHTPLAASSPRGASSASIAKRGTARRRTKSTRSKLNLAGLVAGDSDSSALTQESGDEGGIPETPRESVVTGTDAGTEYAEDEDVEMGEGSPAQEASPRPSRGRPPKNGRRGRAARGASTSTRGTTKKRKR